MPRFLVRLGYEWVTPCYREVEVEASDLNAATAAALALSESDPEFWAQAIECDGEASSTEILEIEELES